MDILDDLRNEILRCKAQLDLATAMYDFAKALDDLGIGERKIDEYLNHVVDEPSETADAIMEKFYNDKTDETERLLRIVMGRSFRIRSLKKQLDNKNDDE